jgi:hypothetical protein
MIRTIRVWDPSKEVYRSINDNFTHLQERITELEAKLEASKKPAPNPTHERNRKRALKSIRQNFRRLRFTNSFIAGYGLECKLRLIHELRLISSREFLRLSRQATALLYAEEGEEAP